MDEDSSLETGFISAEELKDDINECINNDKVFWEKFYERQIWQSQP